MYAGGLYLSEKSKDSEHIINSDEPLNVRMVAITSAFTSKRMSETMRDGFIASTQGNLGPYQARIDQLSSMLDTATIHKGDILDVSYVPNEGVRVYKNGADLKVLITGLDFKQVLYNIWLSETSPVDESLRLGMLGLE